MADTNEAPPEEVVEGAAPYESESARYIRVRAEAKEQAAVTMAEQAKAAAEAKAKRLKANAPDKGVADFLKEARKVEKRINSKKED